MNYSTAVFLINDHVRAVMAVYEDGDRSKMFKTLDASIKVDDYVVVPTDTRLKLTVCKIVEVDDVEPDFDSSVSVPWVVGKIAMEDHEALLAQEKEALDTIRQAEKRRKRDELKASIFAAQADKIKALPIATIGDDEANTASA